MVWEKRWVGRPADTYFSAGGTSPLARSNDSNKLVTQAKLGPLVDDKRRPSGAVFQVVVEAAVCLASLLDDETSAGLMKVFGGGRFVDGQYVPLRNEKIKDVLRLSEGDR